MSKGTSNAIEAGDPLEDPRMFRRCLGQFGTGVAIITSFANGINVGVTVNSFASVSLDPPLVLWSISRKSRSFETFNRGGGFVINILAQDQIELSRHFSSSVEDKFESVPWETGAFGIRKLTGAVAHMECAVESMVEGGDHVILIGRVLRIARYPGEPLLFVQGRYIVGVDHPDAPPTAQVAAPPAASDKQGEGLIPLLFETHHALSGKFDEHRRAEGLGAVPARIVAALYKAGGLSADTVARKNYLGLRDTEDTLADLVVRGVAHKLPNGDFDLTSAGMKLRESVGKRWKEFQESETAGLSPADVRVTAKVLGTLLDNAGPRT